METCFSWSLFLSPPPPDLHLLSLSAWYSLQCVDIIALYWFSIIFSQLLLGGWRGNGQRSSSHTSALPTRFFPPSCLPVPPYLRLKNSWTLWLFYYCLQRNSSRDRAISKTDKKVTKLGSKTFPVFCNKVTFSLIISDAGCWKSNLLLVWIWNSSFKT